MAVRTTSRRASPRASGIILEGPFFEVDPGRTIRQNARALMQRMATVGAAEASRRAASDRRKSPGPSYSASRIRGRVTSLEGKRWAVSMVISADTNGLTAGEAVRVQAALAGRHNPTTRTGRNIGTTKGHEGTARVFSGTAAGLKTLVAGVDLTKGL